MQYQGHICSLVTQGMWPWDPLLPRGTQGMWPWDPLLPRGTRIIRLLSVSLVLSFSAPSLVPRLSCVGGKSLGMRLLSPQPTLATASNESWGRESLGMNEAI